MTTRTSCLVHEINGARLTTHEDVLESHERPLDRLLRRLTKRVGQIQCGITGHNVMLRYAPARLSLQCTSCGYESPGWEFAPPAAVALAAPVRPFLAADPGLTSSIGLLRTPFPPLCSGTNPAVLPAIGSSKTKKRDRGRAVFTCCSGS